MQFLVLIIRQSVEARMYNVQYRRDVDVESSSVALYAVAAMFSVQSRFLVYHNNFE